MANEKISPTPLVDNNQRKTTTNTVRQNLGDKGSKKIVPGKGGINPKYTKDLAFADSTSHFKELNKLQNNPRFVGAKAGGTVMPYRRAQEGNMGLPLGGMPPPPPAQDSVSPEMAEEAKNLGIEVAPPGATAEEVADDQLVLLSEGELVVPANVVRFHGLAQYEKMRKAALAGLDEMQANGQIVSTQENPMPEGLVKPQE